MADWCALPFTPEELGATGDGTTNDSAAFAALGRTLTINGGGNVSLRPVTYVLGWQEPGGEGYAFQRKDLLKFVNCTNPVTISAVGTILKADAGLKYGAFDPATGERVDLPMPLYDGQYIGNAYRGMIHAEGCASVTVRGVELDGNAANLTLGGEWGDSQRQLEAHGLYFKSNMSVVVEDVNSHHHGGDGCQIVWPGLTAEDTAKPHVFRRCNFRFNGRLGVADTGSIGFAAEDCDFSQQGQVFNGEERLNTAPGAGVDIEPEASVTRDATFTRCTFKANYRGPGLIGASGNSADVTFRECVFSGETAGAFVAAKPGYTLEDCILVGYTNFALPADPPSTYTLTRCVFSVDPDYTETGVVDTRQSIWSEAYGMLVDACTCDFGPALLPVTPTANGPIYVNSSFASTAAGEHTFMGTFRGVNTFTLPNGTLNLLLGSGFSTLEQGAEVWVNGERQH